MVLTRAHSVSKMDDLVHNESTNGRSKLDIEDDDCLYSTLVSLGMIKKRECKSKVSTTKDISTKEI